VQAEGAILKEVPEVLFVCVHNAGRSRWRPAPEFSSELFEARSNLGQEWEWVADDKAVEVRCRYVALDKSTGVAGSERAGRGVRSKLAPRRNSSASNQESRT
jgi:hypothetical protein